MAGVFDKTLDLLNAGDKTNENHNSSLITKYISTHLPGHVALDPALCDCWRLPNSTIILSHKSTSPLGEMLTNSLKYTKEPMILLQCSNCEIIYS